MAPRHHRPKNHLVSASLDHWVYCPGSHLSPQGTCTIHYISQACCAMKDRDLIWTGWLCMKLTKSKCCIFLFVSLSIFPPEIKLQQKFLNDYDNELQSVIEKYITMDIPKYHRSIIAQYRCGVIPIRIETGWFRGIDYVFYVL